VPTRLRVRLECRGGAVDAVVRPSHALHGVRQLTILIHGYNADECAAWRSYDRFLDESDLESHPLATGAVCTFYWPGDASLGWFSGASYPLELAAARRSAAQLLAFLRELAAAAGDLAVALVCHSLGNRVALELLKAYVEAGAPAGLRFTSACLMAAAVPVRLVEDAQRLGRAAAAVAGRRTLVLYSESDGVLRWAFPSGETAIPGEGWFPTAVGRFGDPDRTWGEREDMAPYGHGDYWRGRQAAGYVRRLLGIASPAPARTAAIAARPLPAATLGSRTLPRRRVSDDRPGCCDES